MKVIGVIGLNGSGKDEVVKYLNQKYGVPLISVGDLVREIARQRGIAPVREKLDDITREYFERFGEGYFIRAIVDAIRQNHWETAGISGIRSPQDIAILKDAFGKDLILIHVYITDPVVRYERVKKRGSERDKIDYTEFLKQDQISEELFKINEAVKQADYSIPNDGSLEDLHQQIENLIESNHLLNSFRGNN